jgi:hypothetical protein
MRARWTLAAPGAARLVLAALAGPRAATAQRQPLTTLELELEARLTAVSEGPTRGRAP